jgi:uncharacterized membrane protein (TIGR02234 family)
MAAIPLEAGLVSLAWSQTWFTLRLSGAEYPVGGAVAGGALLPLALASLTLVLALAIAGPVFRGILAVLDALLGACVVVVSVWALSDPVRASVPVLAEATGLLDDAAFRDLASASATVWPFVGLAGGILMVLTGVFIAVTSRAWPALGGRYTRSRLESPEGDAVHDWDALTEGEDPTDLR